MLIIVGIGWMLVWAFGERGEQEHSWVGTHQSEHEEARNIRTPQLDLERYSWYEDASIRRLVGRNPSSSQSVLGRLATDKEAVVRMSVAQNPSTPADILQQLATDSSDRVREAVVSNARFNQIGPQPHADAGLRIEALEKLTRLHMQGALTKHEFEAEKRRLLRQ